MLQRSCMAKPCLSMERKKQYNGQPIHPLHIILYKLHIPTSVHSSKPQQNCAGEKTHAFQGRYVAQGTRDLLIFLDSKWSLQFNQQSLVSLLIIQCLFGLFSNAPEHIKTHSRCLPPQIAPTLLLRKSWLAASSMLGAGVILCIPTVLARTVWGLALQHPEQSSRSCRLTLAPFQVSVCWELWIYTVPW